MAEQFDDRILRIGVEVNGQLRTYDGLYLKALVVKMANPLQNECTVQIANLSRDVRDYLMTETSPFNKNKTPKRLVVEAGRKSTGAFRLYVGDITEVTPTQPPDVILTIKAKTSQYDKGNIISTSAAAQSALSGLARDVAGRLGLSLLFEASDKNISNFSFTGAASKLVDKLAEAGRVNAFIDDSKLIVKDWGKALRNVVHELSKDSGMIGIPEFIDQGIRVKYLLDPQSQLGGRIAIRSDINKAASGNYTIAKLSYDLSNRDTSFYCIAEATREA